MRDERPGHYKTIGSLRLIMVSIARLLGHGIAMIRYRILVQNKRPFSLVDKVQNKKVLLTRKRAF